MFTVVLWAAACAYEAPASNAALLDAEVKAREAQRTPYRDMASAAFAARFVPRGAVTLSIGDNQRPIAARPTLCTTTPRGDVYLASTGSSSIAVWSARGSRLRNFPVQTAPEHIAAMFWSERLQSLYVLDSKRHAVLAYAPGGQLRGMQLLNAGQTAAALAVLDDGRLVVGGARWENRDSANLLALHRSDGRLERALLPLDTAVLRNEVQITPPVLMARAGPGELLVGEPTSTRVLVMADDGMMLREVDAAYDGYRSPSPLRLTVPGFEALDAWTQSWDAMVLVHAGPTFTYIAFQTWGRGHKTFRVEVLDRAGRRVATGLIHDSRPICGVGDALVLASVGDPRSVTFTRFADRGRASPRAE